MYLLFTVKKKTGWTRGHLMHLKHFKSTLLYITIYIIINLNSNLFLEKHLVISSKI